MLIRSTTLLLLSFVLCACFQKRDAVPAAGAQDSSGELMPASTEQTRSRIAPYGTWESPITAADLAQAAIDLSDLRTLNGSVYWRESRPAEGGRQVLMRRTPDAQISQLTPPEFNVRTRVHEYGGNAYLVLDDGVVFVNFSDQRLYWQRFTQAPVAITPADYQFADGFVDRTNQRMLWVREDHRAETKQANGEERNEIVALALPGRDGFEPSAGQVLVSGADFYAHPRMAPDGSKLAWIEWDHPNMPWDRTRLMQATVRGTQLINQRARIDSPGMAPLEPQFDAAGVLYAVADPANWWNLVRLSEAKFEVIGSIEREFAGPLWQLGVSSYALKSKQQALVRTSFAARDQLALLDLTSGQYQTIDLPFDAIREVQLLDDNYALVLAQSVRDSSELVQIDLRSGEWNTLHKPKGKDLDSALLSLPVAIEYPSNAGADGQPRTAHAWFYAPKNPRYAASKAELPPLIAMVHGGPTSVSRATLNLSRQFWTSRGFAVVDVNYGGSTTYGRAYRERLNGNWGIVDVQDVIAAVNHLIAEKKIDPKRAAIRGGSAGGFTTLAALAFHDRFNAGTNLFGVSDIAQLAATSHKFESKYDQSLVGPPNAALYRQRSPLFHLEGFNEPLLTLQGSEDKVVPPAQSRAIVEALDQRKVPHGYIEFDGEQHGFRQAANIIRAQEAELYFYGQIFGFTPADSLQPVAIKHWPRGR